MKNIYIKSFVLLALLLFVLLLSSLFLRQEEQATVDNNTPIDNLDLSVRGGDVVITTEQKNTILNDLKENTEKESFNIEDKIDILNNLK